MATWPPQGLERLYQHEVFRSRSPAETHAFVSRELKDHRLSWGRGSVDAAFHRAEVGSMTLCILRHGAAVRIEPDRLTHFMLVQMPLCGRAEIRCGDQTLQVDPSHGALIAPDRPLRLDWQEGCEQLMLKIPRQRLHAVAAQAFVDADGSALDHAIDFQPELALDRGIGPTWCRLVADLLHFLPAAGLAGSGRADPAPDTLPEQAWLRRFEETILLFLLLHQPNSLAKAAARHNSVGLPRQLALAEEYMRENLAEDISLLDVARAARVGLRTLNHLFHRYRDAAPMTVLRNLRLDAARAELLRGERASVTEVAFACGFSHLGRFADYYRRRFGELPKTTSRAATRPI